MVKYCIMGQFSGYIHMDFNTNVATYLRFCIKLILLMYQYMELEALHNVSYVINTIHKIRGAFEKFTPKFYMDISICT